MKSTGRFFARHFWAPALGAILGALVFSGLALAGQEGTQKWAFTTGSYVDTSQAIGADGTIYVGSTGGKFYAINPNGTQKWAFDINSECSSPAIGTDGTIYVGYCTP